MPVLRNWQDNLYIDCQPFYDSLNIHNKDIAFQKLKDTMLIDYPVHVEASIHQDSVIAFTVFRRANIDRDEYVGHVRILCVENSPTIDDRNDVFMNDSVPIGEFQSCVINLDAKLLITLRDKDGHHILTVMNFDGSIIRSIDITASIPNSSVYIPPDNFQTMLWSPDNSSIAVIIKNGSSNRDAIDTYDAFLDDSFYSDDEWAGEYENGGCSRLMIAIISLAPLQLHAIYMPDNIWPSDINWLPDSKTLLFIGIELPGPYKLGKIDFSNRPSNIYKAYIDDSNNNNNNNSHIEYEVELLMNGRQQNLALHSLRISPNGRYLAYTANSAYGAQVQCRHICVSIMENLDDNLTHRHRVISRNLEWKHNVNSNRDSELSDTFLGLYSDLPKTCWTNSSEYMVFHGENGFSNNLYVYVLDVERVYSSWQNGANFAEPERLYKLKCPISDSTDADSQLGSFKIMTVFDNNKLIVRYSNCLHCYTLILGHILRRLYNSCTVDVVWIHLLSGPQQIESVSRHLYSKQDRLYDAVVDEALLLLHDCNNDVRQTNRHENPTIIYMHDYVHSRFSDDQMELGIDIFTMLLCGFNIILLNTIGSIGYGSKPIDIIKDSGYLELVRRSADNLIRSCLESFNLKTDRVIAYAKSWSANVLMHGLASSNNIFIGAVFQNPVCENVTMFVSGDVPDNVWREFTDDRNTYVDFNFNEQTVNKLMQNNAIQLYRSMSMPILLLLSLFDQRAPVQMGLRLKKLYEARSMKCKVRLYPEHHEFQTLSVRADAFVHTYAFCVECISRYLINTRVMFDTGHLRQ